MQFENFFMHENLSSRIVTHTRRDSLAVIAFGKNRRCVSNTICDADYILRDLIQESILEQHQSQQSKIILRTTEKD